MKVAASTAPTLPDQRDQPSVAAVPADGFGQLWRAGPAPLVPAAPVPQDRDPTLPEAVPQVAAAAPMIHWPQAQLLQGGTQSEPVGTGPVAPAAPTKGTAQVAGAGPAPGAAVAMASAVRLPGAAVPMGHPGAEAAVGPIAVPLAGEGGDAPRPPLPAADGAEPGMQAVSETHRAAALPQIRATASKADGPPGPVAASGAGSSLTMRVAPGDVAPMAASPDDQATAAIPLRADLSAESLRAAQPAVANPVPPLAPPGDRALAAVGAAAEAPSPGFRKPLPDARGGLAASLNATRGQVQASGTPFPLPEQPGPACEAPVVPADRPAGFQPHPARARGNGAPAVPGPHPAETLGQAVPSRPNPAPMIPAGLAPASDPPPDAGPGTADKPQRAPAAVLLPDGAVLQRPATPAPSPAFLAGARPTPTPEAVLHPVRALPDVEGAPAQPDRAAAPALAMAVGAAPDGADAASWALVLARVAGLHSRHAPVDGPGQPQPGLVVAPTAAAAGDVTSPAVADSAPPGAWPALRPDAPLPAPGPVPELAVLIPAEEPVAVARSEGGLSGTGRSEATPEQGNTPPAPPPTRQIAEAVRMGSGNPVELVLSPEELGRVVISFQGEGESLRIHLTAERPETLDLLRRHVGELAAELKAQGYDSAGFSFGRSGRNPSDTTQPALPLSPVSETPIPDPQRPMPVHGAGSLDLRL